MLLFSSFQHNNIEEIFYNFNFIIVQMDFDILLISNNDIVYIKTIFFFNLLILLNKFIINLKYELHSKKNINL